MVSIDGMWGDPADDEANIAWTRSAWEAVKEYGTGEVYLNFTGRADDLDALAGELAADHRRITRHDIEYPGGYARLRSQLGQRQR